MNPRAAIGGPADDDWKMDPSGHADALEATAPDLAELLRGKRIDNAAKGFAAKDSVALDAQTTYKNWMKRSIISGLLAVAAASVMVGLSGMPWADAEPTRHWLRVLIMAQFLLLSAGAALVALSRRRNWFEDWREKRASAEGGRAIYFADVLHACAVEEWTTGVQLPARALAYIRRYFWYSQLQYFEKRGAQHLEASRKRAGRHLVFTVMIGLAVAVAVVFGGVALYQLFFPSMPSPEFLDWPIEGVFAALGIFASGVLAANASYEALSRDNENAARYALTAERLKTHGGRWNQPSDAYIAAETAASNGDIAPAVAWLEQLNAILDQEHAHWLTQDEGRAIADQLTRGFSAN